MSAHTPGPWRAYGAAVHSDSGREIIFGKYNTRSAEKAEQEANARLIAAAPDMLAALQAISRAGTLNNQAVIDTMIAAIAKAGEPIKVGDRVRLASGGSVTGTVRRIDNRVALPVVVEWSNGSHGPTTLGSLVKVSP